MNDEIRTKSSSELYADMLCAKDAIDELRRKATTEEVVEYLRLDVIKNLYIFDRTKTVSSARQAKISMDELAKEAKVLEDKKRRESERFQS